VSFEEKEGIRIQWNVKEKINNLSFGTSVNQKGHLSGVSNVICFFLTKSDSGSSVLNRMSQLKQRAF
jgi:hypothetical protein